MKKLLVISVALLLVLSGCGEDEDSEGGTQESWAGSSSHNFGQNCMNCHTSGGQGESTFTIAGSVYASDNSSADTSGTISILVHTAAGGGGTLLKELPVDSSGNFYSTSAVTTSGSYLGFKNSSTGLTRYMSTVGTTGKCTSCHGSTTAKLSF